MSLSSPGLIGGCLVDDINTQIEIHLRDGTYASYTGELIRPVHGVGTNEFAYLANLVGNQTLVAHHGRYDLILAGTITGPPLVTTAQLAKIAHALFQQLR